MSTEESPTKAAGVNFTQRDFQLLAAALTCTKSDFAIDYEQFATVGEFKNSNSAKASWHGLKKKLDKFGSAGGTASSSAPATPTTGGKRKKTDKENGDGETENAEEVSPAKKTKKSPASKKKVATDEDTAAGDSEAVPLPSKKTPASKKSASGDDAAANDGEASSSPSKKSKGPARAKKPANKKNVKPKSEAAAEQADDPVSEDGEVAEGDGGDEETAAPDAKAEEE